MYQVKMNWDKRLCLDGFAVMAFEKGQIYTVSSYTAALLCKNGAAELINDEGE